MPKFKLEITTTLGSCIGETEANSVEQLAALMPDSVLSHSAVPIEEDQRTGAPVEDEQLWHELCGYVRNIETLSEHEEQDDLDSFIDAVEAHLAAAGMDELQVSEYAETHILRLIEAYKTGLTVAEIVQRIAAERNQQ